MSGEAHLRTYLDWWTESGTVEDLARDHPDCLCEQAEAKPEGFGPVSDSEEIRYFVTSTSDIDLKRAPNKSVTAKMFDRIFKSGMSTLRLSQATADEKVRTADILHKFQIARTPEYGGVVGVMDFPAGSIRSVDGVRICCVLDTPLEGRPAHSDVVSKEVVDDPGVRITRRLILFNAIGGGGNFVPSASVTDCDLRPFIPLAAV